MNNQSFIKIFSISEYNLQEFFRENPNFGTKLFHFLKHLSDGQAINFNIFCRAGTHL